MNRQVLSEPKPKKACFLNCRVTANLVIFCDQVLTHGSNVSVTEK